MHVDELKKVFKYDPLTGHITKNGIRVGCIDGSGYLQTNYKYKSYKLHRLAFILMDEELPEQVDHIDRVRTNNIWSNLRPATKQQNAFNMGIRSDNLSGMKGISYRESYDHYRARISVNKQVKEKCFSVLEDAQRWIEQQRNAHHGEFAHNGERARSSMRID